jgi:hypothetical protein
MNENLLHGERNSHKGTFTSIGKIGKLTARSGYDFSSVDSPTAAVLQCGFPFLQNGIPIGRSAGKGGPGSTRHLLQCSDLNGFRHANCQVTKIKDRSGLPAAVASSILYLPATHVPMPLPNQVNRYPAMSTDQEIVSPMPQAPASRFPILSS